MNFDEFKDIKKTTTSKGFGPKAESKPKLSPKRIARITGSNYDKISFESYRHKKGGRVTKQDMIDWIDEKGCNHLLYEACKKAGVEFNKQLKVDQIKEVYFKIPADRRITKGTETYLDELISQNMCKDTRKDFRSKATDHGNLYEPEGIDCFEKWFIAEHGNDYRFDKAPNFIINPKNKLLGSTPDVTIYFQDEEVPDYILELKCPLNPANHARKFRTGELDKRYKNQRLGYFINEPNVDAVFFASYEPTPKEERFRLHVITMHRDNYTEQIEELEKDLSEFAEIYLSELDRLGIDYNHLLE